MEDKSPKAALSLQVGSANESFERKGPCRFLLLPIFHLVVFVGNDDGVIPVVLLINIAKGCHAWLILPWDKVQPYHSNLKMLPMSPHWSVIPCRKCNYRKKLHDGEVVIEFMVALLKKSSSSPSSSSALSRWIRVRDGRVASTKKGSNRKQSLIPRHVTVSVAIHLVVPVEPHRSSSTRCYEIWSIRSTAAS